MINLSSINDIKELMSRHNVKFSKSLGQNFLINDGICEKIADASLIDKNTNVIEIGPGIGTLTRKLSKRAKKVLSVEIDKSFIGILNETLSECDNVKIINADAMELNFPLLIDRNFDGGKVVVCSNLPYYITSPMIMKLLSGSDKRGKTDNNSKPKLDSITLLLQKEAANRICAKAGTKDTGAISIAVNYYSEPELLFKVSRGSFIPSPKVDSQVIRLKLRKEQLFDVKDEEVFFKVVKACFCQRRKTIANSLSAGLNYPKSEIKTILNKSGISQSMRAENLSIDDFNKITEVVIDRR